MLGPLSLYRYLRLERRAFCVERTAAYPAAIQAIFLTETLL